MNDANKEAQDGYLTCEEMAADLRCCKATLRKWTKQGLPHVRIGRKLLYLKSEVAKFARRCPDWME